MELHYDEYTWNGNFVTMVSAWLLYTKDMITSYIGHGDYIPNIRYELLLLLLLKRGWQCKAGRERLTP